MSTTDFKNIPEFTKNIQKILSQAATQNEYLELSQKKPVNKELRLNELPPFDPPKEAACLIISALREHQIFLAQSGINELLKTYLWHTLQPVKENNNLAGRILETISLIFHYACRLDFPLLESFWQYLASCLSFTGKFLLQHEQYQELVLYLKTVSKIGHEAARSGLFTSNIQQNLRSLELISKEKNLKEISILAEFYRQNLER